MLQTFARSVDRFPALRATAGAALLVLLASGLAADGGTGAGTRFQEFQPRVRESRSEVSGLLHPGIGLTKRQLDNMQLHVRQGDQPWASAFEAFARLPRCQVSPRIYYSDWKEIPPGKEGNFVASRMRMDADVAFKQIIMWYVTGDEVYRLNALKILRLYFAIETMHLHWDSQITWGVIAFKFCLVAEILRYSEGQTPESRWTDDDQTRFLKLMVLGEPFIWSTRYWMNQHSIGTEGALAMAIYLDDPKRYAIAVERTTVNASGEPGGNNGSIKYQIREVTENAITREKVSPNIQLVEMGRDIGHAWTNIGALTTCAQIIHNQGTKVDPKTGKPSTAANAVDVFAFLNDRLLAGADYLCRFGLGEPVTYIPCVAKIETDQIFEKINGEPGRFDPYLGILYNHYKYEKQWDMRDPRIRVVAQVYESRLPEGASEDFLASGTLLFTPDEALSR